MTNEGSNRRRLSLLERLLEVGDDVLLVLDADREPDIAIKDRSARLLVALWKATAGPLTRPFACLD